MYAAFLDQLRTNLNDKKTNLTEWIETSKPYQKETNLGLASGEAVESHLETIETSLDLCCQEEIGVCTVCHDHVDTRLLEMDYTAHVCLDHFSREERGRLEQELELAQVVQKSLLPQSIPDSKNREISAFSRPAQVIGGDYFDFFAWGDGSQGLAIADVAGHGISAALHMASIQALLRTLVPTSSSPVEVVRHIQRLLIHNVNFSNFVTIFLAAYDPTTHTIKYCNAGHNPPLLFRRNGDRVAYLKWLNPTGAAIGLIEDLVLNESTVQVQPDDFLVLYTDGLTEASDRTGEQFGPERLSESVQRWANGSSAGLVQHIRQDLLEFTPAELLDDDTTILACRFRS
jgi:sigma-B regulation protein RsbU (phosphoserine phosphatase)